MDVWRIVSSRIWRLFWILFLLLIVLVVRNYMQGQSLLGVNEFILIGFLVFLAIGQEFASLAMVPIISYSLSDKVLVNKILVIVLTVLGGREEALAAVQQAVDSGRRHGHDARFLATLLRHLASVLTALGRQEEALAAAQEAEHLHPKKKKW